MVLGPTWGWQKSFDGPKLYSHMFEMTSKTNKLPNCLFIAGAWTHRICISFRFQLLVESCCTPLKFNMEPENRRLEEEIPIGHHQFQVPSLRIQSPCQMMIGVYNHLLSKVFRFHDHSQKVIGSVGHVKLGECICFVFWIVLCHLKPAMTHDCSPPQKNATKHVETPQEVSKRLVYKWVEP